MSHPHPPSAPGNEPGGPPRRRRGVRALAWATGALLAIVPAGTAAAAPVVERAGRATVQQDARHDEQRTRYVVTLTAQPLAEHLATLPGAATGAGQRRTALAAPAAREYRSHLSRRQSEVAASVGARPQQRYTVALNGFSADLSAAQAQKLAGRADVLSVVPDTLRRLHTTETPEYLGLSGEDGVWAALGGPEGAGEGVVVGVLDTGLWPEHPSFAGEPLPQGPTPERPHLPYRTEDGVIVLEKADGGTFTGACETGEGWLESDCSTKVVGARAFGEGYAAGVEREDWSEFEFASPRDGSGHGSHVAGTAVGRHGVPAHIGGTSFGEGSGMAPGAALAVYKVCWSGATDELDGCSTSDVIAAIDAAVLDGVDVLNLSVGGIPPETVADPMELALLSAASAGIFVAASAGNSGPGDSTVDHVSPWITTVAAATAVPREATVVLGNGRRYVGASLVREPLPAAPLVVSSAAAARGVPASDARLCLPGALDPARVRERIVVCTRGENARVEKSAEVARAGGAGMILVNPSPLGVDPDVHAVPSVHLEDDAGAQVLAYARRRGATASFQPGNTTDTPTWAPQVPGFSSRGPGIPGRGDVLKPDIAAPGVGIVAATAPEAHAGQLWSAHSGTSMSAPHIAGLAALYLQARPEWSPMAVKSAMMTTARTLVGPDGEPVREVFEAGAGFVDPTRSFEPGLVYDSDVEDWIAFVEGTGIETGTGIRPIDPSDLNQPSIAIGSLVGTQTVTRSVTAVTPGLYYATASVAGVDVRVTPRVLHFAAPGETKAFEVTFTARRAEQGAYTSGELVWRGAGTSVRSPIAVRPVPVAAPADVTGSGSAGSVDVTVTAGRSGVLDVEPVGLAAGRVRTGTVEPGAAEEFAVEVPEGALLARFDTDAVDDRADLDLEVYRLEGEEGVLVGLSASAAADERVDLRDPEPGTYLAVVVGYSAAPGEDSSAFRHTEHVVTPESDLGAFTVAPDPLPVRMGRPATYTASWSGLAADQPHLGLVRYGGTDELTVVAVR